jgi:hypothetical protein
MNTRQVPILALFIAAIATPCAYADGSLMVAAQQAEAVVAPRATHLKLVNLPALDFRLRASLSCPGNAESLTLSVADTVTTLNGDDLSEQTSAEASLRVPAQQVALAASSHFCLAEDPASADELTVAGLVTAHASLRCSDDDRSSAHFASVPLVVRLVCIRETVEDQEPSPER